MAKRRCVVCDRAISKSALSLRYMYMLMDEVWAAAGLEPDEQAHLDCVEQRIQRKLKRSDFSNAPLNNWVFWAMDRAKGDRT